MFSNFSSDGNGDYVPDSKSDSDADTECCPGPSSRVKKGKKCRGNQGPAMKKMGKTLVEKGKIVTGELFKMK